MSGEKREKIDEKGMRMLRILAASLLAIGMMQEFIEGDIVDELFNGTAEEEYELFQDHTASEESSNCDDEDDRPLEHFRRRRERVPAATSD